MFRSGWLSFTHSSSRRALARQLIRFSGSPGAQGRMSANSIPSPLRRETSLPEKTCVSRGCRTRRSTFLARVRAQLRSASAALVLPDEEAERVAGARVQRAEHVRAPARRRAASSSSSRRSPARAAARPGSAVDELDAVGQLQVEVEPVDGRRRLDDDARGRRRLPRARARGRARPGARAAAASRARARRRARAGTARSARRARAARRSSARQQADGREARVRRPSFGVA